MALRHTSTYYDASRRTAMHGYALLCTAVHGCARLCTAMHSQWTRPWLVSVHPPFLFHTALPRLPPIRLMRHEHSCAECSWHHSVIASFSLLRYERTRAPPHAQWALHALTLHA